LNELLLQNYNGGNKQTGEQTAMAQTMERYRRAIFASPNGTIDGEHHSQFDIGVVLLTHLSGQMSMTWPQIPVLTVRNTIVAFNLN
jgi:hypothetical protein